MQAAVWNGINIGQLYRSSCSQFEDDPSWYANRMTFRAGGVTGPGKYGPYRVTDFGGTQLPSLEWTVPAIFVGQSNGVQMNNFQTVCGNPDPYLYRTLDWTDYDKEVGVDSQCEFEIIDGSPGEVWIECTEVRTSRITPNESPCIPTDNCTPDCDWSQGTCGHTFQWVGACDIVVQ